MPRNNTSHCEEAYKAKTAIFLKKTRLPHDAHHHKNSQSGNVFIIILIGIVLFGSLMYLFSRSAQQGTGNVSKQQAKLAASEILSYARLVEGAVDRVRRNGCSETEISFENDISSAYEHSSPVARDECKVFDEDGGKITNTLNYDNSNIYYETVYIGEVQIDGIGTTCTNNRCNDLIMVQRLNAWFNNNENAVQGMEICREINNLLGIPNAVLNAISVDDTPSPTINKFTGDFDYDAGGLINLADLQGQPTFCHRIPATGGLSAYSFVHVLLPR